MAGVGKIKEAPEGGVWIWFRNLKEGEVGGVRGGEGELVDWGDDAGVGDGPFEVAGGFATDYAGSGGGGGGVARVRGGRFCALGEVVGSAWGEEFCDTEVALGRGS